MASEVVSYMMIFSLGITLVVAIGFSMINLSDSIHDSTAEVELNDIMGDIKNIILKQIGVDSIDGVFSFSIGLDIPDRLTQRFPYEISITQTNGIYELIGTSERISRDFIFTKSLWLSSDDYTLSGSLDSSLSNPSILIEKDITNSVTLSLRNF